VIYLSYFLTASGLTLLGWATLLVLCPARPCAEARIDALVSGLQRRLGLVVSGLLVSLVFLAAAAIYTRPTLSLEGFAGQYAALAADPFGIHPEIFFPHRILTPLVSYLLLLRGDLIVVTNLCMAWLVLYVGYGYFRTRVSHPADAVAATAVLAFSQVTLNSMFNSGYTDSASLALLLLMWWFRERPVWFWLCFLLGLFNRESVVFLTPWFVWLRLGDNRRPWTKRLGEIGVALAVSLVCYGAFRYWLASRQEFRFTVGFYFRDLPSRPTYWFRQSGWRQLVGLLGFLKAMWIVPIVAAFHAWTRQRRVVWSMLLILACTWAQLFIAYDSSRLFTQGFLLVVVAMEYLFTAGPAWSTRLVGWSVIVSLFVPQLYTAASVVTLFRPWVDYGISNPWVVGTSFALLAVLGAVIVVCERRRGAIGAWRMAKDE